MKIAGKKIEGVARKAVIIQREEGDITFIFEAVLDESEFDKICPRPAPKMVMLPGGRKSPNFEDATYKKAIDNWSEKKTSWSFLKSISSTPDLEWETVDLANPDTWANYTDELTTSGFSPTEQYKLLKAYMYVSGLDEAKVNEAVESFLADPQETQGN